MSFHQMSGRNQSFDMNKQLMILFLHTPGCTLHCIENHIYGLNISELHQKDLVENILLTKIQIKVVTGKILAGDIITFRALS